MGLLDFVPVVGPAIEGLAGIAGQMSANAANAAQARALDSGTFQEKILAARLGNALSDARLPFERGRAAVMEAVSQMVMPFLSTAAEGTRQFVASLEKLLAVWEPGRGVMGPAFEKADSLREGIKRDLEEHKRFPGRGILREKLFPRKQWWQRGSPGAGGSF